MAYREIVSEAKRLPLHEQLQLEVPVTRILLDTNVVLDFLLDRAPFADAAAALPGLLRAGFLEQLATS
jgi:hypothetical protein